MRFRRIIFWLPWVGVALALATLPWWLGVVAAPVARHWGLSFGRYERLGYSRFALHEVRFVRGSVRITADQVVADSPLVWLWRRNRPGVWPIEADHWAVVVDPRPTVGTPLGMAALQDRLCRIGARLQRWLPHARARNGRVAWPGGGFSLDQAQWQAGILDARGLHWPAGTAHVRGDFTAPGVIAARADESDRALAATVRWLPASASGEVSVWDQPVFIRATFAGHLWLPVGAHVEVRDWNVPAERLGAGALYGALRGNGRGDWDGAHWSVAARFTAAPRSSSAVPLAVDVSATGDRRGWSVDQFHVALPFAAADLSGPVAFDYRRELPSAGARFHAALDLGRGPWAGAAGRAEAEVLIQPTAAVPTLTFTLTARDLSWRGLPVGTGMARARLDWPRLTVSAAELKGEAGEVSGNGAYDFRMRTFYAVRAKGRIDDRGRRLLFPSAPAWASAEAELSAEGAWPNVAHRGDLVLTGVQLGSLPALGARVHWQGVGMTSASVQAGFTGGGAHAEITALADRAGATVSQFTWTPARGLPWHLAQAAQIGWTPPLQVAGVVMTGPASARAALDWQGGPDGALTVAITGLAAKDLAGLLPPAALPWTIRTLTLDGHFAGGALLFRGAVQGTIGVPGQVAEIEVEANGDANRVQVTAARLSAGAHVFAHADGQAAVSWRTVPHPHWEIDRAAPLSLHAEAEPGSPVWAELAGAAGLALDAPRARIDLTGTLGQPVGAAELSAERLALAAGGSRQRVPPLTGLRIQVHADQAGLVLDSLQAQLAGQALSASGRLPLGTGRWWQGWQAHGAGWDWNAAQGHLTLAEGDLAPLARFFPEYLAPQGRWGGQATLAGGDLQGAVQVHGAATRPLGPLGLIQSIEGSVVWKGRTARLDHLQGEIGGQAVQATGQVDFPEGRAPRLALKLRGSNVPVVRQAGLLMRADLDLQAATDPGGLTRLTGSVTLRDGLLLSDWTDLLAAGPSGGARAPPYFSVSLPPFSLWQLAVDIQGDQSLRVRTSLFSGTASPHFHLSGTLADPRAIGQLDVQQGTISLPFATFTVQIGAVRLTAEDPYHPQVEVNATARRYDYDLRMEVTGPVDQPTVTFSSNPALPSDQVLLMVMAGQAPANGATLNPSASQVAGLGAYFGQSLFQGAGGGDSRLEVISGQDVSLNGRPTYELDYRLGRDWWLVGEYDIFDDYNGGVRWRVYSSGGKR